MAYTAPLFTISEKWLTVVPVAAPKYNIFDFSDKSIFFNPLWIAADNLLLYGFHDLYSFFIVIF